MRLRLLVPALLLPTLALAADWPQWRGPNRTGVSPEKGLMREWPKGGPKLAWSVSDIDKGYSTPAVVGDRVYVISNKGGSEYALALDASNGKRIWSVKLGAVGENQGPQYPGSRSTPTVDGELLYALGSGGDLVCLERGKGTERWRKHLVKDFGGEMGSWAYSESPLVDGDRVVVTPGGKAATLVALNKKTGGVAWRSAVPGGDAAGYSSIVVANPASGKQYVQYLGGGVVGVDAATGKFLWRSNRTSDAAANIPTPVVGGDLVFVASGRTGGAAIRIGADRKGELVYFEGALGTHIGGSVLIDGNLYGFTKRGLVCAELATGKVRWANPSVGIGAVASADGLLIVRSEKKGEVALVEVDATQYKEKGRFTQPKRSDKNAWPHPVIANGKLYLRDGEHLFCYDISKP